MIDWVGLRESIGRMPCEESQLYALPLVEVVKRSAKLTAVVPVLQFASGVLGARTVGDLFRDDALQERLEDAFSAREQRNFSRTIEVVLQREAQAIVKATGGKEPIVPASPPVTTPAPAAQELLSPKDLEKLAEQSLVYAEIYFERSFAMGVFRIYASLARCLDPYLGPRLAAHHRLKPDELRQIALHHLHAAVANAAPAVEKRRAYLARRREPEDPWLRDRIDALMRTREQLSKAPALTDLPRPTGVRQLTYPVAPGHFVEEPPSLVVDARHAEHVVELRTANVQHRGLAWAGSVDQAVEQVALCDWAIDALCDPEGEMYRALIAWRSVPEWSRLVKRFEARLGPPLASPAAPAPDRPPNERIVFRFLQLERGSQVRLAVQSKRKNGGFSSGRQIDLSYASRMRLDPVEQEIVDLMQLGRPLTWTRDEAYGRFLFRLYDVLSRHPHVYIEGNDQPCRLSRTRLRLGVEPSLEPGTFQFRFFMGNVEMSPRDVATGVLHRGFVVVMDNAANAVLYGTVDATTVALAEALVDHPSSNLPSAAIDLILAPLQANTQRPIDLDLPSEVRGRAESADSRPVIRLALRPGGALLLSVCVRPLAGGPVVVPGDTPKTLHGTGSDGARVFVERDLEGEASKAENLLAALPLAGAERPGPFDVTINDPDQAMNVVATLVPLSDAGEIIVEWPEGARIRVAATASRRSLQVEVFRRRDWFGVEGSVEAAGEKIPMAALLEAVRGGKHYVRLKKGDLLAINKELRRSLSRVDDVLFQSGNQLDIHAPGIALLEEMLEEPAAQLKAAREWIELRERWREAKNLEPEPPQNLEATLRPYQLDGYKWLSRLAALGAGACLADDMGLGKTVQTLALLLSRAQLGPALVIAPTSVCPSWANEAKRFAPSLQLSLYRSANRQSLLQGTGPGHLLVASYDVMLRDVEALADIQFATLVLDEAHVLKNAESKRAAAARKLSSSFRLALTGTPVENHLGDLWSLFRVLMPPLLGSWERFRERFAAPIERSKDRQRQQALTALVQPYLLRRTKDEVAPELPPRTDIVSFVTLSAAERTLYETERQAAVASVKAKPGGRTKTAAASDGEQRFAILAALTRLRQLACHPRLRDSSSTVPSSKLSAFLALVEDLRSSGHRALVFSQFTTHLDLVSEQLFARRIPHAVLQGSTPAAARERLVSEFQAGAYDLFLISLKAGGTGLNLTAADYVVHLDPWWNPAAEDQASDRAHRIGQDKPVTVVRLISRGTIEEAVLALHGDKRELARSILEGGEGAARLSTAELAALMEAGANDTELAEDAPESEPLD